MGRGTGTPPVLGQGKDQVQTPVGSITTARERERTYQLTSTWNDSTMLRLGEESTSEVEELSKGLDSWQI